MHEHIAGSALRVIPHAGHYVMREQPAEERAVAPFNAAVIDALNRWTFAPGTMHGQPVVIGNPSRSVLLHTDTRGQRNRYQESDQFTHIAFLPCWPTLVDDVASTIPCKVP